MGAFFKQRDYMPGGRPTKMTPETIAKLEEAFLWGCTDSEACLFAGIVPSTLYRYLEANPEFSERKEVMKTNPVLQAKRIQNDELAGNDKTFALDVLKRKEGSKLNVDAQVDTSVTWNVTGVRNAGRPEE